jgi:hypothetical protein
MVFSRVKKRKRAEPIPRNAFPHVVEKVSDIIQDKNKISILFQGLVTDSEARELFNM